MIRLDSGLARITMLGALLGIALNAYLNNKEDIFSQSAKRYFIKPTQNREDPVKFENKTETGCSYMEDLDSEKLMQLHQLNQLEHTYNCIDSNWIHANHRLQITYWKTKTPNAKMQAHPYEQQPNGQEWSQEVNQFILQTNTLKNE